MSKVVQYTVFARDLFKKEEIVSKAIKYSSYFESKSDLYCII
ncbi:protein of unknown function [Candidatus Nitrosocosmicus franklandus]|uniref:Uncharacterized protein n=1 Tax=Candidatus Nitrosocosmicus franklandianus TaxID=1798806 RepID=A0A484IC58_9ARCH|nr:protein of unknown function [Candidatus Nitrosocosmicus franklandus]